MKEYIHICPKCLSTYGYPGKRPGECTVCHISTVFSGYNSDEWYAFPYQTRMTMAGILAAEPQTNNLAAEISRRDAAAVEKKAAIKAAIQEMKLTTGFGFDGYEITDYIDVLCDDMIVGMGALRSLSASFNNSIAAWTGTEAEVVGEKLREVKTALRGRVMQNAAERGANALIGIDFESSAVSASFLMVSMTATAVKITPKAPRET